MDTSGYGGTLLKKSIIVETSHPVQPSVTLLISGDVEKFAVIAPNKLFLRGKPGETLKGALTVIPEPKYPFKITGARAKIGEGIQYQVEETTVDGKQQFILNVTAERKLPGRFFDVIYLKTDSAIRSELPITVYGQVMDPAAAVGPLKPGGPGGAMPLPLPLPAPSEARPKP